MNKKQEIKQAVADLMKNYNNYRNAYMAHFGTDAGCNDGFNEWLRDYNNIDIMSAVKKHEVAQ